MAQITIYLPDAIEHKIRKAAKAKKQSVSRWISERVTQNLDDTWPQEVLDAGGSCPDFPTVQELRAGFGPDSSRERFE
jgi:hypothetical protein